MAERALIVEDGDAVASTLAAQLAAAGIEPDRAPPGQALDALRGEHALAIVRAERAELAAALKGRDPTLSVVLLFRDDDALAAAAPDPAGMDGLLVGPLSATSVAATARAMARLAAQQRRLADAPRGPTAAREGFELHRRLVLMEVKRARRYRYPLSVAVVAVDGWAAVAAPLAPAARAKLLGELLLTLARSLRTTDLPVLHAGERFLVVMPHTASEGAMIVAGRLCERVATRAGAPRITVSVGVGCFEGEGHVSLGSLLGEAARGLERARGEGGSRAARVPSARPERKVDLGW